MSTSQSEPERIRKERPSIAILDKKKQPKSYSPKSTFATPLSVRMSHETTLNTLIYSLWFLSPLIFGKQLKNKWTIKRGEAGLKLWIFVFFMSVAAEGSEPSLSDHQTQSGVSTLTQICMFGSDLLCLCFSPYLWIHSLTEAQTLLINILLFTSPLVKSASFTLFLFYMSFNILIV